MRGHRAIRFVILFVCFALLCVILLRNAWLCDDAYISLRTVDNFVNGYGLTWNVAERVQVFTHPLWVIIIIPLYTITHEVYFTVLSLSLILSLGAIGWYAFGISRSVWSTVIGLLAAAGSAAFVDFSTSGLENPLTFFILAAFLYIYFRKKHDIRTLMLLSLIASLGAVNRLDTILLFLPMLVYLFWKNRSWRAVGMVIIGFIPLIAWEMFSLVYYGFPFPNTAYAKLSTGLSRPDLWQHGLWYILYTLRTDPITAIMILSGILIPIIGRNKQQLVPAIGIGLYLLYILNIGGCFMAGRYLAAPFLMAIITLSTYRKVPTTLLALWAVMIITLGLTPQDSPIYAKKSDTGNPAKIWHGVVRERDWYNPTHGLLNVIATGGRPQHHWLDEGREARRNGLTFIPHVAVGMVGFEAGPGAFILDVFAITDPLLARLPMNKYLSYRIGHFGRIVPPGYKRTVQSGKNLITDSSLVAWYDKLAVLTRADIFSPGRLSEIIAFTFGAYDYLIDDYLAPHVSRVEYEDISAVRDDGIIGVFADNYVFGADGLEIDLGQVSHATQAELCRSQNRAERMSFMLDSEIVGSGVIPAAGIRPDQFATIRLGVPSDAIERGYNTIRIIPEGDVGGYHNVGRLVLVDSGK